MTDQKTQCCQNVLRLNYVTREVGSAKMTVRGTRKCNLIFSQVFCPDYLLCIKCAIYIY
jgi:hypothetical protein